MKKVLSFIVVWVLGLGMIGTGALSSYRIGIDTYTMQDRLDTDSFGSNNRLDYTHTVFGEYATATGGCHPCKYVHGALKKLYGLGGHDFYYVSLVDANKNAWDRIADDYNIYGFPTVYFDGGYEVVVGSTENVSSDMDQFVLSIENCSNRQVPDIHAVLEVDWIGDATMNIILSVQNNETTSYNGYLRVYVTEIVSTMWYDANGDPYTFAFLDYAFDEDICINGGESWQNSINWDGFEHDDGYGNSFGGITRNNVMVIAVVFNATGHQGYSEPPDGHPFDAYYVDELTAICFDLPPELEIDNITGGFGGFGKGGLVCAEVKNIGDAEVIDVEWTITVTGGLLRRINVTSGGTIDTLGFDSSRIVCTDVPLRGFGRIEITVMADVISKRATGFVFGPFVIIN